MADLRRELETALGQALWARGEALRAGDDARLAAVDAAIARALVALREAADGGAPEDAATAADGPAAATVYVVRLSGIEPTVEALERAEYRLGPGRDDRHNRTRTVRLRPGARYLVLRDARYRGRGPGNALAKAVREALGQPAERGYSGHPRHDGSWEIWRLPSGIDRVDAPGDPHRVLVLPADGEPRIEVVAREI